MDVDALNRVVKGQLESFQKLLGLLEEQHDLLISNDVFKLESIVDQIKFCNKSVAENEVERRKIIGAQQMKVVVEASDDEELNENYRELIKRLHEVKVQKETNDMLIKMGLGYSTRMLNILSPGGTNSTTYNYRGNYKK